ncbi:hypothetical protein AKJ47_01310 [candidate division MSBL1 archaeon SCGC-AAA261G05]|uniref:HTH marR-type domain-containing protein n=1 Tax=candidate division MSBL1 archaeon SCGC-AAA261G05 TaxID=1698276 RepID=A0A133VBZ2_9EURY|nr:hypothetical protein AKJ47_01310 [candidate division MSBL1 archaeon SCGC-AAA261G05]
MAENVKEDPETPLKKLFGNTPLVRVVDVLIENPRIGYSKRELAEAAEIKLDDLNKIWRKLEEKNLIHKSPRAGDTALYTANLESSLLKALATLESKDNVKKRLKENYQELSATRRESKRKQREN